jgi:hypothetical protein
MLYQINSRTNQLEPITSAWNPAELELEKYLITSAESDVKVMAESIFGEPLLLISNQVRTATKKRADILALDRHGNSVVIELKRDKGRLGVETQALQYLADFSGYKGRHFLKKFSSAGVNEDSILGFVGDNATIDDLNANSRVILVARSFDESVFAIGEWLSSKGIAFRCIAYTPIEINSKRMLSFSTAFDHSPQGLFQLSFSSNAREPEIFWHNIANTSPEWWTFLRTKGQIPACFQNSPGDQGEKILTKYIEGDTVIAYAKGYGAVGWGIVENPKYRIIPVGDPHDDKLGGNCRHRINFTWKAAAKSLSDGLSPDAVRSQFHIYHPISTSVSIQRQNGLALIRELSLRFAGET